MELKAELEQKVKDLENLLGLKQQELARAQQSMEQLVGVVNKIVGMLEATQGVLNLIIKKEKQDDTETIDVEKEVKPDTDVDVARDVN